MTLAQRHASGALTPVQLIPSGNGAVAVLIGVVGSILLNITIKFLGASVGSCIALSKSLALTLLNIIRIHVV